MDPDYDFGKLYRKLVHQLQLSPDVAEMLLQRILKILEQEKQGVIYREESEEFDI